jgi:hypothetical protein
LARHDTAGLPVLATHPDNFVIFSKGSAFAEATARQVPQMKRIIFCSGGLFIAL